MINEQIILEFEVYLSRRLKKSSINQYKSCLKSFMKNGYNIRNKDDYIDYLQKHIIQKRSTHHYDVLVKFVKWYFKEKEDIELQKDILDAIKVLGKKNFDPKKETSYLEDYEQMQVINNLKMYKHSLIAWIQKETGVRAGDVLRLKRHNESNDTDIKFALYDKEIIMNIRFTQKGDKVRIIPIFNQELINALDEYISTVFLDEEYLFCSREKVREQNKKDYFKVENKNYYDYWKDLKETCTKLGLDPHKFTSHDIRRNFASDVWTNTLERKDLLALQKAMGHSHVDTTIRYLRTSGLEVQDIFKKRFDKK
jgi:integrase